MIRLLIFIFIINNVISNERNWWKFTEIYEVYIWSYKDSNGDGIGDLKGITSKLDHIEDLQIDSIWISPFFQSSKIDNGYDICDYKDVDPVFGTLADFDELSREAEKRGIKIFIDLVINHSSDEHIWFKNSIEQIKPYDKYYIWKDPKGYDKNLKPIPPNNWLSLFGGSMWEWNEKRQQFYLHQFGKKQPDYDLRNENVLQEFKDILEFWFNKGASGVRLDAAPYLIEDAQFRDQPLLNPNIKKETLNRLDYSPEYTKNLPENYEVVRKLRMYMDEMNRKRGGYERVIVVEAYADPDVIIGYYGTEAHPVAQYPFNFKFAMTKKYFTSVSLHSFITDWLNRIPKHGVPVWNAENHDRSRIGSRFVQEYSIMINIVLMLLPGVPSIYYGQEICMVDGLVRDDQEKDTIILPGTVRTRDLPRTPMQWDTTQNAGFTSSLKPWLPVNPNFWHSNVESQRNNEYSCLNIFKELSRLRKTKTCKYGRYDGYMLSTWVYAFTRVLEKYDTYIVVLNLGTEYEFVNLHGQIPNLRVFLKVLVASENSGYHKGDTIRVKPKIPNLFVMKPLSAIVLLNTNSKNKVGEENDKTT